MSTKMLASQTIKLRHSVTFILTPLQLDIVLFLMNMRFSFVLITFMRFRSRTVTGHERFRIWVGMVDNWWWSEYSNLTVHFIKHKSSGSKTVKESVEKPGEVHVLNMSANSASSRLLCCKSLWEGANERLLGEIWQIYVHKTRLNSLNCHGSTYVWIYSI